MSTVKKKKHENAVQSSIALLEASDYCQHAAVAIETLMTFVKKSYKPTKERRQVDKTLNSLAEALPLVSSMIRCRATLCAPAGSDIHYAKSRRERNSTSKNLSAIETIDSFIQRSKEISSVCKWWF